MQINSNIVSDESGFCHVSFQSNVRELAGIQNACAQSAGVCRLLFIYFLCIYLFIYKYLLCISEGAVLKKINKDATLHYTPYNLFEEMTLAIVTIQCYYDIL